MCPVAIVPSGIFAAEIALSAIFGVVTAEVFITSVVTFVIAIIYPLI
jgi:hypothetical protein